MRAARILGVAFIVLKNWVSLEMTSFRVLPSTLTEQNNSANVSIRMPRCAYHLAENDYRMRGADVIVFEFIKIRNIHKLMRV